MFAEFERRTTDLGARYTLVDETVEILTSSANALLCKGQTHKILDSLVHLGHRIDGA